MTCQKFFRGPQVEKSWSEPLKPSGAAYRRLKANKDKILRIVRAPYMHM